MYVICMHMYMFACLGIRMWCSCGGQGLTHYISFLIALHCLRQGLLQKLVQLGDSDWLACRRDLLSLAPKCWDYKQTTMLT